MTKVHVESDGSLAVDILKSLSSWTGIRKDLILETHLLLTQHQDLILSHIFREANASATWLS